MTKKKKEKKHKPEVNKNKELKKAEPEKKLRIISEVKKEDRFSLDEE